MYCINRGFSTTNIDGLVKLSETLKIVHIMEKYECYKNVQSH